MRVFCAYNAFTLEDRFLIADGENLKRIRRSQAFSQRDLSRLTGVSADTIGQIERGNRNVRPSTIRKLARALGVEPAKLMGDITELD